MSQDKNKSIELPRRQALLFKAVQGKGNVDIRLLFKAVFEEAAPDYTDAQQKLGPVITRLNRRLRDGKLIVKPGTLKRTYCLTPIVKS